jgi:tRNA (adenine22-N1)-methyltransferase
MIELTARTKSIVDMVPKCRVVADIGADHGKVAAELIACVRCERVIATDISEPSLHKTQLLAGELGLEERIMTRLGDGLSVLSANEADVIIVAGLGGETIIDMLEKSKFIWRDSVLILQPMRRQGMLREYLFKQGYYIQSECLAFENERIYQLLQVNGRRENVLPPGWPAGFFEFGWKMYEQMPLELEKAARITYNGLRMKLDQAEQNAQRHSYTQLEHSVAQLEHFLKFLGGQA